MYLSANNNLIFATSKVSDGNMAYVQGEHGSVEENRKKFFESLGISADKIVVASVAHGSDVAKVDSSDVKNTIEADASITNKREVFLAVLTADCLPIGFYDSKNNSIALVHASRHNINLIITATIDDLKMKFKTELSNLIAEIGPSIGPCHYQVDLWGKAEDLMREMGLREENIFNQKICTYDSPDYYSHREFEEKNLQEDDRMITVLGIR